MVTIPDHDRGFGSIARHRQGMCQQITLIVAGAVQFGAKFVGQLTRQPEMCSDFSGVGMGFSGGQTHRIPRVLQARQKVGDTVINPVFKQADRGVSFPIQVNRHLRIVHL